MNFKKLLLMIVIIIMSASLLDAADTAVIIPEKNAYDVTETLIETAGDVLDDAFWPDIKTGDINFEKLINIDLTSCDNSVEQKCSDTKGGNCTVAIGACKTELNTKTGNVMNAAPVGVVFNRYFGNKKPYELVVRTDDTIIFPVFDSAHSFGNIIKDSKSGHEFLVLLLWTDEASIKSMKYLPLIEVKDLKRLEKNGNQSVMKIYKKIGTSRWFEISSMAFDKDYFQDPKIESISVNQVGDLMINYKNIKVPKKGKVLKRMSVIYQY